MMRALPLIAALALAACDAPAPTAATPAADGTLAGAWRIASIAGVKTKVPGSMTFTGNSVSGSFGCNQFSATYSYDGRLINVAAPTVTEMACPGEAGRQERNGLRHLTMPMQVVPNGANMLVLSGREGQSFVLER